MLGLHPLLDVHVARGEVALLGLDLVAEVVLEVLQQGDLLHEFSLLGVGGDLPLLDGVDLVPGFLLDVLELAKPLE